MLLNSCARFLPTLIHGINVAAVLLAGLILLLTAVAKAYQVVLLVPVLVLLVVYWRCRTNPRVAAGYCGISIGLLGWILLCEHIVTIDNVFGTQISTRLRLGLRLLSYVDDALRTPDRLYLEPCCGDPLTWHYRPGSTYRKSFDCATCYAPYETVVDETGSLNRLSGLMQSHEHVDLFLAGDSVLQGHGVRSVVELLRDQLPVTLWNLSMAGYTARQKVNALLTYALPKQPKWLIIEFYAGNDLKEAIRAEACDGLGDFRCQVNAPEVRRRLSQHPRYQTIFEPPPMDILARFDSAAQENLTLATTRYLINTAKGALKESLLAKGNRSSGTRDAAHAFYNTGVAAPPGGSSGFFVVREGQWLAYLKTALRVIEQEYTRFGAKLEGLDPKPTVILLYNPTSYEVYRGMWIDPIAEADQVSAFQREALSAFAHTHGWHFLDVTDPLRQEVQARQVWLFGRYDKGHWSPQGTAIVAEVLSRALRAVLDQGEVSRSTGVR